MAEVDLRVGGRFRVAMLAADGETHHVSGTYLELVPNRKQVFGWAWRAGPRTARPPHPDRGPPIEIMGNAEGNDR